MMTIFAYIRDGVVQEIFPSDPIWPSDLDVRPVSNSVEPGWTVDEAGAFHPPTPVASAPRTRFSFLEFMDLFTEVEQLAIAGAAMTDVSTKLWYDRAIGAQFIDMSDARLAAGLDALVGGDLLKALRRDQVIAGEKPEG